MGTLLPAVWFDLGALERDCLLSLAIDGRASGTELHDRIGNRPKREKRQTTYRALGELREREWVEAEPGAGRTNEYHLTAGGWAVVSEVRKAVGAAEVATP